VIDTHLDALVREEAREFRVDSRVYTDTEIFEQEMRRIFERMWICVAHESQLRTPGDFITASIGRQPVIVTRDRSEGQVHVLFNRCRHRGATVCQEKAGNTRFFRCGYHGWTYHLGGALAGVPHRSEEYDEDFDLTHGLVSVPRVRVLHGFVFACVLAEGDELTDQLGNAVEYLEAFSRFGGSEVASIDTSAGVSRLAYDGNWKLQLENTVDSYHPDFVHQSQGRLIQRRRGNATPRTSDAQDDLRTWDLGAGHAAFDLAPGGPKAGLSGNFFRGPAFHISIFPNLCLLPSQIRFVRPIRVDRTEVDAYPVMVEGMEPEVIAGRLRAFEEFYGPAGFGAPDDLEMFNRVQAGVGADVELDGLRWIDMSRGLVDEHVEPDGRRSCPWFDESPQRAIYRGWRQVMAGPSDG